MRLIFRFSQQVIQALEENPGVDLVPDGRGMSPSEPLSGWHEANSLEGEKLCYEIPGCSSHCGWTRQLAAAISEILHSDKAL